MINLEILPAKNLINICVQGTKGKKYGNKCWQNVRDQDYGD